MDLSPLQKRDARSTADGDPEELSAAAVSGASVAYLINQYPKVSHTFVRREILALEDLGLRVQRIALRGWDAEVVDPEDALERERTEYVLRNGLSAVLAAAFRKFLSEPRTFLRVLAKAIAMSRRADRPLPYHIIYLCHACRILEMLQKSGASHLHAHFGTNPAEVAMYTRLLGGPNYSFTVHGPDEFDKGDFLGLDSKVGHAKFVAVVNSYCRSQMFRRTRLEDWPKLHQVHCGLDQAFHAVPPSAPAEAPRFVCVGRLCEQKGQLLLLRAFRPVAGRFPQARLVLAGDGEMRGQIEREIDKLGLSEQVKITGWISAHQVRDEILAARALVLPSFQESLPVVIMEAMALRRPVISTYVAGIPELVIPGKTGWLVPAGSQGELVDAMIACIEAPSSELDRMGDMAHQRVTTRHDVIREAQKLKSLFAAPDLAPVIAEWKP